MLWYQHTATPACREGPIGPRAQGGSGHTRPPQAAGLQQRGAAPAAGSAGNGEPT